MTDKKTVLVTGATRGIGLELATHYTKSGWDVIAAARNLDLADKLKAIVPYKIVQLDTGNEDSILQAAKMLEGEAINLLINNAGIGRSDSVETATKASIMEQFEVNAVGPFLVTRAFLPHLRAAVDKSGSATVGQISSVMGSVSDNEGRATATQGSANILVNHIGGRRSAVVITAMPHLAIIVIAIIHVYC